MESILSQQGSPTTCPVAIIIRGDKILLGLRHYTADKWKDISVWTAPGGRCEVGETVEETLRRETFEETGIKDLKITGYIGEVAGAKEGDRLLMFAAVTGEEPILMEPDKFSEWQWFKPKEIPSNIINERAKEAILKLFESQSS